MPYKLTDCSFHTVPWSHNLYDEDFEPLDFDELVALQEVHKNKLLNEALFDVAKVLGIEQAVLTPNEAVDVKPVFSPFYMQAM